MSNQPLPGGVVVEPGQAPETRNGIEDASQGSGLKFIAALNGTTAGGGYELALATDAEVRACSQHASLRWWGLEALLASPEVHDNVKAYFR